MNDNSDNQPYLPSKKLFLAFKISDLEKIEALQKGLIYMNSLSYFSEIEEKTLISVRNDPLEKVYSKTHSGKGKNSPRILMKVSGEEKDEFIDLGDDVNLKIEYGDPSNIMIFCMSAFADNGTGRIPGERDGAFHLDKRFKEFGTHLLIIKNIDEFIQRLNKAISTSNHVYWSENFHEIYGLVQYKDLKNFSGHIGIFRKDIKYEWQQEFRICFGVTNEGLNINGGFELNIGDISDITEVIPVQTMIKNPIKITRTVVKKVGDKYFEVQE